MILVSCIVLFLLGLAAAESLIVVKFPVVTQLINFGKRHAVKLGVLAIVFGVSFSIQWFEQILRGHTEPMHAFLMVLTIANMFALGVLASYDAIRGNLVNADVKWFKCFTKTRDISLPFHSILGVGGVALSLVTFLGHI